MENKIKQDNLLTNGVLLSDEIISLIKKAKIKLGISLDGITSKSHDFLRGKGTFNILKNKLETIGKLGIDLTLTFTANSVNNEELEALAQYAFNVLNVRCVFVNNYAQ